MSSPELVVNSYLEADIIIDNSADRSSVQFYEKQDTELITIIRLPFLIMCNGDTCAASILNHLENIAKKRLEERLANKLQYDSRCLEIEYSDSYATRGMLNQYSRMTIRKGIKTLIDKGFISKARNTKNATSAYRLNLHIIAMAYHQATLDQHEYLGIEDENDTVLSFPEVPCQVLDIQKQTSLKIDNAYLNLDSGPVYFKTQEYTPENIKEHQDAILESGSSLPHGKAESLSTFPMPSLRSSICESPIEISPDKSSGGQEVGSLQPALIHEDSKASELQPSEERIYEARIPSSLQESSSVPRLMSVRYSKECARSITPLDPSLQLLQIYDRAPKKLKKQFFRKKVSVLTAKYGDQLERLIDEYGIEECCTAMENFLGDQYWRENGLPLPAFLKYIDRFLDDSEPPEPRKVVEVQKQDEIAPRPSQAAKTPIQDEAADAAKQKESIKRELRYVRMLASRVDEPFDLMAEFASADQSRVEYLVSTMQAKFLEKFGREAPTMP